MDKNYLMLLFFLMLIFSGCGTSPAQKDNANSPQTSTSEQQCVQSSDCQADYYCINNSCVQSTGTPSLPFTCKEGEEQIVTKGDAEPEICHCNDKNEIICPSDEKKSEEQPVGEVPTLQK